MRLGSLCLLLTLLASGGCVEKGDTKVTQKKTASGNLCEILCEKVDERCGATRNCEADCTDNSETCPFEAQRFLECAELKPVGCDASGDYYVSGCNAERDDLDECLANAAAPVAECAEAFADCEQVSDCCEESFCLETSQPEFAGGSLCLPTCTGARDCITGCCADIDTGDSVCGFPADCAPVDLGYPCFSDADCASDWCWDGACVDSCEVNEDCGVGFLGSANVCGVADDGDGNDIGVCFPGCEDDSDCVSYSIVSDVELACREDETGSYCY